MTRNSDRFRSMNGHKVRVTLVFLIVMATTAVATAQMGMGTQKDIQTPGLDIEAQIGFAPLNPPNRPLSISALFRNNTNKTIEGRLIAKNVWGSGRYDLGEVFLAAGQVRRFSAIYDLSGWANVQLSYVVDGKTIWRKEFDTGMSSYHDSVTDISRVGIVHDGASKFVFERAVNDPEPEDDKSEADAGNYGGSYESGPIALPTANIKTWQLPDHFAPLSELDAIVLLDSVRVEQVNAGQWQAVADWVCQGGVLAVHQSGKQIVDELKRVSRLRVDPGEVSGAFQVYSVGIGQIVIYQDRYFVDDSQTNEQAFAEYLTAIPAHTLPSLAGADDLYTDVDQSTRNQLWLLIYFIGYALLTAAAMLVLAKRSRKQVLIYTGSVVLIGCVTAGFTGASIRSARGDLKWLSMTFVGSSGAFQIASLEAKSGGGTGGAVWLSGKKPDLQVLTQQRKTRDRWNDEWDPSQGSAFRAFTYQSSTSDNEATFLAQAEMAAWGTRNLRATDFIPDFTRLPCTLEVSEDEQISIKLQNTTEYRLSDVSILLAVGEQPVPIDSTDYSYNVYYQIRQPELSPGQINEESAHKVSPETLPSPFQRSPVYAREFTPAVDIAEVRAFLFATMEKSPNLQFDEQRSDFRETGALHLLIQELTLDEIKGWQNLKAPIESYEDYQDGMMGIDGSAFE